MTSEIECPVDGCEYSGELNSVSSHVNASPDHPNWADIRDQVPALDAGSEESGESNDGDNSGGEKDSSEGGAPEEPDEESGESQEVDNSSDGEEGPEGGALDEQGDSDPDDPMDDDQWTKATNSGESDGDQDVDSDADGGDDGAGIPIPVSTTALFWGVGLLLTAFILYQFLITSDASEKDVEEVESETEDSDEMTEVGGGLIEA